MTLPGPHPLRPHVDPRSVPDALFASDNSYGIPLLDDRLQAQYCHLPVATWGSIKRNQTMPGTYHFYTQDYRFESLWKDPTPVLNSACLAAVEPNFTTSEQMPVAVALYQIYRKRWIARYWQSQGLRIWVDLNVAVPYNMFNLYGVPRSWRAFMTRGYTGRLDWLDMEYDLVRNYHGDEDLLFAVYGGGAAVRTHCGERGYLHIPETMDVAKGKIDG